MLLRCYPAAWRARYGDELEHVIAMSSGGHRPGLAACLDLVRGGLRERSRASGLIGDDRPQPERSRAGSLLVLCAWATFVVAGLATQKISEHWQAATPPASRGTPSAAFDILVVAAATGTALVLAGIACALPALGTFLRVGGWSSIRRPLLRAAVSTALAVAATVGLVVWAHRLSATQRDGHDLVYALAAAGWALVVVASLAAWTAAAVATARRIAFGARLLRAEAWLGAGVSAAMLAMSIATLVWSASAGSGASSFVPRMIGPLALMSIATVLGLFGSARAVRSLPS